MSPGRRFVVDALEQALWAMAFYGVGEFVGAALAPSAINTLREANTVMGANLPRGMTRAQFGEVMQWGSGNASAQAQIGALTAQQLRAAGVTAEMAENWAAAYEGIGRITPANPSAAGRADLMRWVAELLRDQK